MEIDDRAFHSDGHPSYLVDTGKHKGILAWLTSTDHKRIGILYMVSLLTWFSVGVTFGFLQRLELLTPGKTIVDPQAYNSFFTLHGVIMLFIFVIPGIPVIFGNFFLPIMLGTEDVAFPRLNLLSWYVYVIASILLILSLVLPGGAPDTGWTFYIPYSVRTGTNMMLCLFAIFAVGFSSILTGINFITTIHRMRAPGMTFFKMPLFIWSLYATAWIQVMVTPIISITLFLVAMERIFHIGIFDPALGGDPILYQHLFWTYSHPAVYIMVLPAMGVISEIIPTFSRRAAFGYKMIAFSSLGIALFGTLVWGHHMFATGMSNTGDFVFSLFTFLVAIPSAIKVFNWTATLYKGSIVLDPPMLWGLAFIFLFAIGGLSGIIQGVLSVDIQITDTYFIVGHIHYVVFGTTGIALFAGLHYWLPKIVGRIYNFKIAKIAFWIFFVGFNTLYFPMFIVGWMGMPRRYYDSLPQFTIYHQIMTVGSWIMISGLILMFYNLIKSVKYGKIVTAKNLWYGETLEWSTDTPPIHKNFEKLPVVYEQPYQFARNDEPFLEKEEENI